jgi:hypothetical protein
MDNTNPAVDDSTVPSTHDSNTDLINLYSVGHMSVCEQWKEGRDEVPFKQTLQLKGPQGEIVRVSALFDGGAMVGAMCSTIFRMIKHRLSGWGPSRRQLRMANGTIIPSEAVWKGAMVLGGVTFRGEFEVFDSKGGWAFLFGKPLMRAAGAIHDFATDIVSIRSGNGTVTLANQINEHTAEHATTLGVSLTLDAKQWGIGKGGSSGWKPPSRQVSITQTNAATEQIDKHEHITESTTGHETLLEATQGVQECKNNTPDNRTEDKTHGNENSEETKGVDDTPTGEVIIDVVTDRLAYETDSTNPYNSESENLTQINAIGTETGSIFTRHTDPFKTETGHQNIRTNHARRRPHTRTAGNGQSSGHRICRLLRTGHKRGEHRSRRLAQTEDPRRSNLPNQDRPKVYDTTATEILERQGGRNASGWDHCTDTPPRCTQRGSHGPRTEGARRLRPTTRRTQAPGQRRVHCTRYNQRFKHATKTRTTGNAQGHNRVTEMADLPGLQQSQQGHPNRPHATGGHTS